MFNELDPYRYSSVKGISYRTLQDIFDEMFNEGRICDEENMVQFIRDHNKLPGVNRDDIEEVVHTFIDDTYNG